MICSFESEAYRHFMDIARKAIYKVETFASAEEAGHAKVAVTEAVTAYIMARCLSSPIRSRLTLCSRNPRAPPATR